ncbi:MAG: Omp28-related outer membrane protein [Saprospirales bacterium]|nr:Omp28-related outer membrane protein [Saprospirales bacterium]
MKIKFLFSLSLVLALNIQSVAAQEVAEVQQTLITKRTATWCPYCGSWGWDFFESLLATTSAKSVLVAAHFGGSKLENPTSIAFVNNLGSSSQPKFFVNNELQNVTSSNLPSALTVVQTKVNDNYQAAPLANVGLKTAWNGNNLDIQTRTRFFQNGDGAYYLAIYLVEDNVLEIQASQIGTVAHDRILRGAATPTTFGDLLLNGSVAAGTEYTSTYTVSTSAYNIDNLDIVGIIWKEEGGKYLVVNVWAIDAKPTVSSNTELAHVDGLQASLYPTILQGNQATVSIVLDAPQELSLAVVNGQGQQVALVFQGLLQAGSHELPLEGSRLSAGGWYSVVIQTHKGVVGALPFLRP